MGVEVERFNNSTIESITHEVDNGIWIGGPATTSEPVPVSRNKMDASRRSEATDRFSTKATSSNW